MYETLGQHFRWIPENVDARTRRRQSALMKGQSFKNIARLLNSIGRNAMFHLQAHGANF